jgi:hypothetical protein
MMEDAAQALGKVAIDMRDGKHVGISDARAGSLTAIGTNKHPAYFTSVHASQVCICGYGRVTGTHLMRWASAAKLGKRR